MKQAMNGHRRDPACHRGENTTLGTQAGRVLKEKSTKWRRKDGRNERPEARRRAEEKWKGGKWKKKRKRSKKKKRSRERRRWKTCKELIDSFSVKKVEKNREEKESKIRTKRPNVRRSGKWFLFLLILA